MVVYGNFKAESYSIVIQKADAYAAFTKQIEIFVTIKCPCIELEALSILNQRSY